MEAFIFLDEPKSKVQNEDLNIFYLTNDSPERPPYPAIFARNKTALRICYSDMEFCIDSEVLDHSRWYKGRLFFRIQKL